MRLSGVLTAAVILSVGCACAEHVDYRWQNVNAQSVIGVLDRSKTVVGMDGSLQSAGRRTAFALVDEQGEHPITGGPGTSQTLHRGYLPMVETNCRLGGTACAMLAFAAEDQHTTWDLVRLTVTNCGDAPRRIGATARLEAHEAALRAAGATLYDGDRPLALADRPARGTASASVCRNDWGNETGWAPQPGWAAPIGPADPAFSNITVGWGGVPITYAFHAAPGQRLQVFAGLCEGWWSEVGQRILDIRLNGALVRTLDTVADLGHNVPGLVRGEAVADRDGWVRLVVQANPKARDQNAILNCVFVFPADTPVDAAALVQGASPLKPLYKVSCGSPSDQRLTLGCLAVSALVAPGNSATFWIRFPGADDKAASAEASAASGEALLAQATAFWDGLFGSGAQFMVPDREVADFYKASLAYTLLLRDRVGDYYVVKPGATVYNYFWFRDGAYIARSHGIAGHPAEEEKDLRAFIHSPLPGAVNAMGTAPIEQHADGVWVAPGGEWDGQGQALWAIMGHFELTGDRRWLRGAYPAIRKGARWIARIRRTTRRAEDLGTAHWGLFPRGEGEAIVSNQYCLYHDFWGVLGIRKAAEAAEALGEASDAAWMRREERDFAACVTAAARESACVDPEGRAYIPAAAGVPGGRIWGDIAAVFPCAVMKPDDPLIGSSFERMWDRRLQDEYQFVDGRKIWNYITADWIQALWLQGHRDRALTLFWGYLNHAYTTKAWIEEMFPDSRVGTGDQPHGWAAANFVLLLRNMLVREQGGTLQLLYGVPGEWLAGGEPIEVRGAPTALGGPVSFQVRGATQGGLVTVQITQVPSRASALRVNLPGTRVLQFEGPAAKRLSAKGASVGPDYVEVPAKKGAYQVRVTFVRAAP